MAKKKPTGQRIGGDEYVATPMLIHTKDRHGRPKLVTLLHDDETIDLAGGEEFLIAYVLRRMVRKQK